LSKYIAASEGSSPGDIAADPPPFSRSFLLNSFVKEVGPSLIYLDVISLLAAFYVAFKDYPLFKGESKTWSLS